MSRKPKKYDAPGSWQDRLRYLVATAALVMTLFAMLYDSWLFPRNPEPARKKKAAVMAVTLAQTIEAFAEDYQSLPVPVDQLPSAPPVDLDTGTSKAPGIARILLGMETSVPPQNPRKINYLDGFKQARPGKTPDISPTDGLIVDPSGSAIFDTWGHPFLLRLDTDGDGRVRNPETSPAEPEWIETRVLVWSSEDGSR